MESTVQLLATFVGQPKLIGQDPRGNDVWSSINRQPVRGDSLYLTQTGLAGDKVTDDRPKRHGGQIHGGHDKAVYVFPVEGYAAWREELGTDAFVGRSLGENWLTKGVSESDVRVGDRWIIGDAHLMVTKPRTPCKTLEVHFGGLPMMRLMAENGRCGWYLQVLKPGLVPVGGTITVRRHSSDQPTIAQAFSAKMNKS